MAPPTSPPAIETTTDLGRPGRHPGLGSGACLWLFRHGEVREDFQGTAYGGMDVPLSAAGEADTAAVAERFGALGPRAILSSPLVRARTLGEALARRSGAPLTLDAGLVEIERGRWAGLRVAHLHERYASEVAAFYADPWSWNGHGGENDRDVLARAWPPFERALRAVAGGLLFVTAHYNVLRVLLARALGIAPEHSFRLRIDLSAACRLVDGETGFVLERSNVRTPQGGFASEGT